MKPPLPLATLSSVGRKGHVASAAAPDYRRFAAWSRERVAHLRVEWRRVSLAGLRKMPVKQTHLPVKQICTADSYVAAQNPQPWHGGPMARLDNLGSG